MLLVACFSWVPIALLEGQADPAAGRTPIDLWAGLPAGPHRVGYLRLAPTSGVIHVWYPAASEGERLSLRAYLDDGAARLTSFLSGAGIAAGTIDSLLNASLHASRNARTLDRDLPLVLVAQGNAQDVMEQVVLCEYLASIGFVVAATPSPMVRTPMQQEEQVGPFAEQQADDLARAIGQVAAVVRVDSQRVGVIGHSFGARAALLLAMRETAPPLRAIVSLDGGIGTSVASDAFRQAPSFRTEATVPPLLHFFEELDAFMAPDFALLRSLRIVELVLKPTRDMRHTHFTTWGFAAAIFPELARATRASDGTASALHAVLEETAAFLRRHVTARDGGAKQGSRRPAATQGVGDIEPARRVAGSSGPWRVPPS